MNTISLKAGSLTRLLGHWRTENSSDASYRQLARALRLLIIDGRIGIGIRLPGERELAQAIGVSRTTLAAAYDELREEGYLLSRRGSGSITRFPSTRSAAPDPREEQDRADLIDWTSAALPAPPGLWHAYGEAMARLPSQLSGIGYETLGLPSLRQAIAHDYERRGCPTRAEQIIVTSGAQSGLSLVLQALTGPGDRVVIEHPTYHNAIGAIMRNYRQPVPLGFPVLGWDMAAIAAAFRQTGPRLAYFIPDFHVPTGRLMDDECRSMLVGLAAQTRTPLLIDETMAETGFHAAAITPVAAYDPGGHTVISLGSASKRFWGGLRIGWIRASEQRIAEFARLRATHDMATPVLEQLAVTVLLERDETGDVRREELRSRCDNLIASLTKALPDWCVTTPEGGLSLWAELPWAGASAIAATAQSFGLRLGAGPRFGIDGAFERYLRLPFTLSEPDMAAAVERLARADAQLRRRPDAGSHNPFSDINATRLI